jgi:hypothetical protein
VNRAAFVLLLSACASAPPPASFVMPRAGGWSEVAHALEAAGQPTDRIDGESVVTTRWLDTGLGYGFVGGHRANVFRRYVAMINGEAVTLRVETQRCAEGSWDPLALVGACELLQGLLPRDREALGEITAKVRVTVGGRQP